MRLRLFRALLMLSMIVILLLLIWGQSLISVSVKNEVRDILRQKLSSSACRLKISGENLSSCEEIDRLYKDTSLYPLWVNDKGLVPQAAQLLSALTAADKEGLNPERYHAELIRQYMDVKTQSPERLAELELLLSDAFLSYGEHLYAGSVFGDGMNVNRAAHLKTLHLQDTLKAAIAGNKIARTLATLSSSTPAYLRLKKQLAFYMAIRSGGGWGLLPDSLRLKEGDSSGYMHALYKRLAYTENILSCSLHDIYDSNAVRIVRAFQARNGIKATGELDRETMIALNVPVEERIRQLQLNMERWRWLPHQPASEYISLNIAAFMLEVKKSEETKLSMRAIVGTEYNRTPVFYADMRYLVINPYWEVPQSIAVKEILPRLKQSPAWLGKNHMLLYKASAPDDPVSPYTVNWSRISGKNFSFRIRQQPGPWNALGRIKFMFPNPYHVYLHGTPYPSLFEKEKRTFSHGCMRIEKPEQLAEYLLWDTRGWNRQNIEKAVSTGKEKIVIIPRPMPVYVCYWTAWVDENGLLQMRNDVYGHDNVLADVFIRSNINFFSLK
jgi:murein L,D-transpeptidase YcbB/YkuD